MILQPDEDTKLTGGNVAGNDTPSGDGGNVWSVVSGPDHGTVTMNADGTYTYTPDPNYNGHDQFKYRITDANGDVSTATVTITVTPVNDPPTVGNYDVTTQEDTQTTGTVIGNDVDSSLSYSLGTPASNGSAVVNPDGTWTYTPKANYNGPDSFTVIVSDGTLTATSTIKITINPVNDAPTVGNYSSTTQEDTPTSGTVVGSDVDNSLTYSLGTQASNGSAVVNPDGTWTYTPNSNYNGHDSFTVTVSDGTLTTISTVNITVNSVNDAPTAMNDSATTNEDNSVDIDVLANDTDVDTGDSKTINSFTQPGNGATYLVGGKIRYIPNPNWYGTDTFTYTMQDSSGAISNTATVTITVNPVNDAPIAADDSTSTNEDNSVDINVLANDTDVDTGDSLTVTIGTGADAPKHGTANVKSDGTITYTPNHDYNGSDSFKYTITDTGGLTSTATVTININPVNDAPTVYNYSITTPEDTQTSGAVVGNDVDSTLTYSLGTQASHGSVIVKPDGSWTYTPEENYNGHDSFTVTVNDGTLTTTSTVNITVTPVNDAPVVNNDSANTKEYKSTNITVLSNDSDADGDSLTVTNITQPNHGSATINADGTIIYTPNSNWYGLDSFTYTVSDGNGGTATATVNITVNQAVSNLYIKTTTSNQNPTTGEIFTIKYKLGNYGPDEAKNVTITFQLPEGLDFINIHVDNGKCSYNETTRTVTWTLDSVPVGDPYLYLTVKAADDGTYKITPNVASDTYNSNTGDNGTISINIQTNNNPGNGTSTKTVKAATKTTIGLQETGLPLNYLLLAVLMVLGGLVPKRK